jgi:rhodanese-related sulfurtransferase
MPACRPWISQSAAVSALQSLRTMLRVVLASCAKRARCGPGWGPVLHGRRRDEVEIGAGLCADHGMPPRWIVVVRDSILVVILGAGIALASNALRREHRIPLVARSAPEILVPCPEVKGDAEALAPAEVRPGAEGVALVDAREPAEFARWHLPGAISIPFDFLEPPSAAAVKQVLATRARRVVVYGDGADPDTGEQLARALAGRGIRNLAFVKGGAPALRSSEARRPGEGRR